HFQAAVGVRSYSDLFGCEYGVRKKILTAPTGGGAGCHLPVVPKNVVGADVEDFQAAVGIAARCQMRGLVGRCAKKGRPDRARLIARIELAEPVQDVVQSRVEKRQPSAAVSNRT